MIFKSWLQVAAAAQQTSLADQAPTDLDVTAPFDVNQAARAGVATS